MSAATGAPAATDRSILPVGALPPQGVLARYTSALAHAGAPPVVTFEYAVEQFGARNLSQVHRIYRAGTNERDETTTIDGHQLLKSRIRIRRNVADQYAIANLAPRPDAYAFAFVEAQPVGDHLEYRFTTVPHNRTSFTVKAVVIDSQSFLPKAIDYSAVGATTVGDGTVQYARVGMYWLVREAAVSAKLGGKPARERITWGKYRFPRDLPPSTFAQPRPTLSPIPIAP